MQGKAGHAEVPRGMPAVVTTEAQLCAARDAQWTTDLGRMRILRNIA